MTRVPVRMLEAEPAFAEVHLPRHAGFGHPLERPVDGRAADPRVPGSDRVHELVGADVPVLLQEHGDDDIALAGTPAAGRSVPFDELSRRLHGRRPLAGEDG